jgi:hypothetical protein
MNHDSTKSLLSSLGYRARDLKNNANHAHLAANDLGSPDSERKAYAETALPSHLAAALRDAEEVARAVPALRLLVSGENEAPKKVECLGSSIVVRYKKPTNCKGAGWLATLWRDRELTFRASSHFTYEDKDNDGADIAAARALAKFEAYCNGIEGLPKAAFRLSGRVSLGNGSYAYTFTR